MKLYLSFLVVMALSLIGAEELKQTITTKSGKVYEDAIVEKINPDGIDIGYVNDDGAFVLRAIDFKDLPADLQKQYKYDPAKAQDYSNKVASYKAKNMDEVTESEESKLKGIVAKLKEKASGEDVTVSTEEMRYAIQAYRCSVEIEAKETLRSGTLVKIEKLYSGHEPNSKEIIIDSIKIPHDGTWTGFLYPTGLKAKYKGDTLPVYTENIEKAESLLDNYLKIYSAYAASNDTTSSGDAPDQYIAEDADYDDYDDDDDGNGFYYYDHYDYPAYFIGPNYHACDWWRRHYVPKHPNPKPHHNNKNNKPKENKSHVDNKKHDDNKSHVDNKKSPESNNTHVVNHYNFTTKDNYVYKNVKNKNVSSCSNLRSTNHHTSSSRSSRSSHSSHSVSHGGRH